MLEMTFVIIVGSLVLVAKVVRWFWIKGKEAITASKEMKELSAKAKTKFYREVNDILED